MDQESAGSNPARPAKRRKRQKSPDARTADALKAEGWWSYKVERFSPYIKRFQDAYGFGDRHAFKRDIPGSLMINSCSQGKVQEHIAKFAALQAFRDYLEDTTGGRRVQIWEWRLTGARGERKLFGARVYEPGSGGEWTCRDYQKGMVI